jgi:DNA primase
MPVTNESKEQLKSSVDIVDVISDYIEVKKAGANFKANCPFHGEKTPSFVISPSKQIYHCFGCGVGGDVFKFVQEYEKLEFTEAVEKVASRHNFTLQYTNDHGNKKDYARVMDAVTGYFVGQLRDEDRQYLAGRGLKAETMREWNVGWAPGTRKQLKDIDSLLLPPEELIDLGIIALDGERKYAKFSERIMFPIRSHTGKVVGYSGRSLKPEAKAKYLNSPQTPLFDKSRILFGFDKAKEHIYAKKFAIVMEGQLDVILSHQVGIRTAVATQGTALTEKHLPMLKKTEAKVVLAYDGDNAGRKAAYKAAWLLSTHGFGGGVVLFAEGEDPASMVADGREDDLKKMLLSSKDMIEFVIDAIASSHNLSDARAKSAALKQCKEYLQALNDDIVSAEYHGFVARRLGIDAAHVGTGTVPSPVKQEHVPGQKAGTEDLLFYTMYRHPGLVDTAVDICDHEAWSNQAVYQALLQEQKDASVFAPVLLKEGLVELDEQMFQHVLRAKQRSYLSDLKMKLQLSGADIDEILAVNEKMKGL